MKTFLIVLAIIVVVLLIIAINLAIGYGIYWVLFHFGAPQWVAVAAGLAYVCISGWVTNNKTNK